MTYTTKQAFDELCKLAMDKQAISVNLVTRSLRRLANSNADPVRARKFVDSARSWTTHKQKQLDQARLAGVKDNHYPLEQTGAIDRNTISSLLDARQHVARLHGDMSRQPGFNPWPVTAPTPLNKYVRRRSGNERRPLSRMSKSQASGAYAPDRHSVVYAGSSPEVAMHELGHSVKRNTGFVGDAVARLVEEMKANRYGSQIARYLRRSPNTPANLLPAADGKNFRITSRLSEDSYHLPQLRSALQPSRMQWNSGSLPQVSTATSSGIKRYDQIGELVDRVSRPGDRAWITDRLRLANRLVDRTNIPPEKIFTSGFK